MSARSVATAAILAVTCSSCWYDVGDASSAGASTPDGGAGAGAGSGTGTGVGGAAKCPSDGCPDGSTCDTAAGICDLSAQPPCEMLVVVRDKTRFRGDTCTGLDASTCGVPHPHLVLQLLPGVDWHISLPADARGSNVDNTCEALSMGCNQDFIIAGGQRLAVYRKDACGEVTFDVTPTQ